MTLDNDDKAEVRRMAELEVRKYFDHFLEKIYPKLVEAHVTGCPYGKRISKVKWMLAGAAGVLAVLVPTLGKTLITLLF